MWHNARCARLRVQKRESDVPKDKNYTAKQNDLAEKENIQLQQ